MKWLWAPLLVFVLLSVPFSVSAQSGLPLFDPEWQLVPEASDIDASCPEGAPLGFGGVLQLIQNGMNAAISFGIIICVLVIMGAGILWILTPTNPENHSQAKKILTNAALGLLIILSAWLIVDFVMKLLYNPNIENFGPWNKILTGGDACIIAKDPNPLFSGSVSSIAGKSAEEFNFPAQTGPGACNANNLLAAARNAGVTLSSADANVFACIAAPESSCGANLRNYRWGKGSSAYGAFQVLLSTNAKHYENAACRKAAGVGENVRLDCARGFSGGNPIPNSPIVQRCINAASNLECSLAAAVSLKNEKGDFTPWRADLNSSRQRACMSGS